MTHTFTLSVPEPLLPLVAQILREQVFPEDDGVTQVAIMREQRCSVRAFTDAQACVDRLKQAVDDAARARGRT